MKSKQKLDNPKQISTEDSQSPAWKQQELNWDSTANLQENIKLEQVGQTLTKDNPANPISGKYVFEDGEWWYINPHDNRRRRAETSQKVANTRMWVNGKYISKSHPLHKPGRYKSFGDAAFESLNNYKNSRQGQVYILYSPAYPSWIKVGMAVDAEDRIKQFQTASPHRDYMLVKTYDTDDRRKAESEVHKLLEEKYERKNEWFVLSAPVAKDILDGYFNENN